MQDCSTGRIVEVPAEMLNNIPEWPKGGLEKHLREQMKSKIPAEVQGPIFSIDEIVEVKGGKFRVRGFEGGLLHLEGVPR